MKVQTTLVTLSGLLSLAGALPAVKRDSSINEPAVAAPNGVKITLTNAAPAPTGVDNSNSNSCMSGDCNSNSNSNSNSCMSGDCNSNSNSCMSGDCGMNMDTTTMMMESSTMMMDTTSTMMMESSTMMMDTTSTMMAESSMMTEMATSTYQTAYATATYGSGYMPSSYDSCVQQCVASYGAPPSMVTASPSMPPSYNNGGGSGATHTVIVAPTQGVLRYVPFAVNASVGDTVRFVWGAGPHTVTKSSALNLCNATSDAFKSGMQNKSFVFDQVVNDTTPTFYYCGVPGHCEKGMFGVINPPNAEPASQGTAQAMMAMMSQNSSDFASQWSYTMMNTNNSTMASNWGSNMNVAAMSTDPEAQMALLQNVMFTRLAMASNPQFVSSDGAFNPDISKGMAIPMDPLKLAANGTSTPSSTGSGNAASSPNDSSSTASAPATTNTGGARRSIASSASAVVAAVAIAALVL